MAKIWLAVVLAGLIVFFATQIYAFWGRRSEAEASYMEAQNYLQKAKADGIQWRNDLDYLSNPYNLEKEIRARFNYKNPGEQSLILIATSTGR